MLVITDNTTFSKCGFFDGKPVFISFLKLSKGVFQQRVYYEGEIIINEISMFNIGSEEFILKAIKEHLYTLANQE